MKYRSAGLVLLILAIASAAAYVALHRSPKPTVSATPVATPAPALEPVRLETAYERSTSTGLVINIAYPNLVGGETDRVAAFNDAVHRDMDLHLGEVTSARAELDANPPEGAPDWGLYLSSDVRTPLKTAHLVSTIVTWQEFTGGAHPNSFYSTYAFDLDQDKLLTIFDCFMPGTPSTTALGALSMLTRADLMSRADMDKLFIDDGTAPTADNFKEFALTPDGLLILFPPYQVAPYADGPQEVMIPWDKLSSLNEDLVKE